MVTTPACPAVTFSCIDVVCPAGIKTFAVAEGDAVESDTMEGSLLVCVTNTASGAGCDNETGCLAVSPGFNLMGVRMIDGEPAAVTVRLAVAGPYPGAVAVT